MLNQKVSGNSNIIILDCSCSIADPELGLKLYVKEHIPGAVLVDFDRYVTGKVAHGTGRHPMPDRETFCKSMEYFGIRPIVRLFFMTRAASDLRHAFGMNFAGWAWKMSAS